MQTVLELFDEYRRALRHALPKPRADNFGAALSDDACALVAAILVLATVEDDEDEAESEDASFPKLVDT